MEMFLKHVQEQPVPPAKLVLDVPIWLDTLILGLMEKQPDKRPLNAAKVGQLLSEIQEKVEALQSAGVDMARARVIDQPRARRNVDETDREAARTLSGKKLKRKKKRLHFYERLWFQAVGLLTILGTMGLVLYLVLKPPAPEKLVQQAEAWMKNPEQWDKARSGPIKDYLAIYGGRTDLQEMTDKMRQWANQVDVHNCDQKLARMLQLERKGFNPNVHEDDEGESLGFKAAKAEDAGDMVGARKYWSEAREKVGTTPWGLLATQRLAQLDAVAKEEDRLKSLIGQLGKSRQEPKLEGPVQQAFLATRFEALNDKAMARLQFEKLKKATAEQTENRFWYLLAAKKVKELDADKENWEKDRVQLIKDWLNAAKRGESLRNNFVIVSTLAALYDDNSDLKGDEAKELQPLVDEARQKAKEIADTLGLR